MTSLAAIAGYLVLQLAIGAWVSRRIRTEDDYLVAGRRLGYLLTTFSTFATWFGAETCIGAAGRAYADGLSLATAEPFGYALCLLLMGLVFAGPLWRRQLTTFADLYRTRFSPSVERAAALILIPSSVLWAAAQIRGFGSVLSSATGLPPELTVIAATGFCILYTAFGGMLADAVTDLLQGVVLLVGLGALLVAVVVHAGGPAAAAQAFLGSGRLHLAPAGGASLLDAVEAWSIPVLGSVLATELVSRMISARSPRVARRSAFLAGGLYLAAGLVPVFIGVVAAGALPPMADPEQLLPAVARELLPSLGYALFAAALISAILSTVDSTLLVASGLLSHNLLVPAFAVTGQRARLLLARGGVAGFGLVACILALRAEGVLALVEQASAFGGAGVLVTVVFGLFTSVGGAGTALATLVASTVAYLAFAAGGLPHPFLASVAVALATYLAGAAAGMLAARRRVGLV